MVKFKTLAMMLAIVCITVVGLSSCDKSLNEPMAQTELRNNSPALVESSTTQTYSPNRWIGWGYVDQSIRDDYYRAYGEASQDFNSWGIEHRYLPVAFYAAFNATHGYSESYGEENQMLNELCNDNSWGSQFGHGGVAYPNSNQGFADFKRDILNCIHNKGVPVVIYAKLNTPWPGSQGRLHNALTVWSASGTHVGVTKVSDIPGQIFSLNIVLDWQDLFRKAINASGQENSPVANVAFMTSDTL